MKKLLILAALCLFSIPALRAQEDVNNYIYNEDENGNWFEIQECVYIAAGQSEIISIAQGSWTYNGYNPSYMISYLLCRELYPNGPLRMWSTPDEMAIEAYVPPGTPSGSIFYIDFSAYYNWAYGTMAIIVL